MLKVAKKQRCSYPPFGISIKPEPVSMDFNNVAIQQNFKPFRLRPEGSRSSLAEARILSRIQAVQNGLTSLNIDLTGR